MKNENLDNSISSSVGMNNKNQRKNVLAPVQGVKNKEFLNPALQIGFKALPQILKQSPYQPASYEEAVEYLLQQSYTRKVQSEEGWTKYERYESCVDTKQLHQFGLGIYLFLEFGKRLVIILCIMSCVCLVPVIHTYLNGKGLSNYPESYMISIGQTSLGNVESGDQMIYLMYTVSDLLSMLFLFIFYLSWRSFHREIVENDQRDVSIVNPTNYVLSVTGFNHSTPDLEKQLTEYFNTVFKGVYEVEVVYNYVGNFHKFVEYDQLIEKREKERHILKNRDKGNEDLIEIQEQIAKVEQYLSHQSLIFEPLYAIVHFRSLKSRNHFINHCRQYSLVDKLSYNLKRALCCQLLPPKIQLFQKKDALMIKQLRLSRPEQINWGNLDIPSASRTGRWLMSILLVALSILVTSSLIALCTLYVSSTAACNDYDPSVTLETAQTEGGQTLYCFCAANFAQIFVDGKIGSVCEGLSNTILFANITQIGASAVSALSNFILIMIVSQIAKHLLKPDSKPKEYSFVFVGVFLSNYINASLLPLIMNGNIFGFQSIQYLTFIEFIDFNKVSVFNDFNHDWYAVVAPYYINFLIISAVTPIFGLISYAVFSCWNHYRVLNACRNANVSKDPMIQKEANSIIASLIFDLPTQQALTCLYFFMTIMYSSLIPLLLPITTISMLTMYHCKKVVILRYSLRVPADHALSEKTVTLIPFAILAHFLMGIWSHTAPGVFAESAYVISINFSLFSGEIDRIFLDIPMLAGLVIIICWIVLDYTLGSLASCFHEFCLKDDMQVPKQFSSIENSPFQKRMKKANILGSFKLANSPTYGHAIKAYNELKAKLKKNERQMRTTKRDQSKKSSNLLNSMSSSKIIPVLGQTTQSLYPSLAVVKDSNQLNPEKVNENEN